MDEQLFKHEGMKARTFIDLGERPDYFRGYMRGLRRRYHGENFGDSGEHEKWLSVIDDDYRREMAQGYHDGYYGPYAWK